LADKNVNDSGPGHMSNIYLYRSSGGTDKERIKWVKKEAKEKMGLSLESIKEAFDGIKNYVNLDDVQQASLTAIEAEIANPTQDDDETSPVVELSPEDLKGLLHVAENPSQDITDK